MGMAGKLGEESELGRGHEMEDVKQNVIGEGSKSRRGIATPGGAHLFFK